jgi:hypothetical protein
MPEIGSGQQQTPQFQTYGDTQGQNQGGNWLRQSEQFVGSLRQSVYQLHQAVSQFRNPDTREIARAAVNQAETALTQIESCINVEKQNQGLQETGERYRTMQSR